MRSIAAITGPALALSLVACAAPGAVADLPPQYLVAGVDGTAPAFYGRNLEDADRAVSNRRQRGELSKSQARALKKQHQALRNLGDRYAADGMPESEARELDMLSQALLDLSRSPVQPPAR
jgi:hypothetical protein